MAGDYDSAIPVRLRDGSNNVITSQANGGQRALDVGVNVGGVQIDPRAIRALTPTDEIKVRLEDGSGTAVTSQANGGQRALDVGVNVAGVQVDPRSIRALTASDVVAVNLRDEAGVAYSDANPLQIAIVVSGAEIDPRSIRALTATDVVAVNLRDEAGVAYSDANPLQVAPVIGGAEVSPSNPIPVYETSSPGTPVDDYNLHANLAINASDSHDYTVSAAKTLRLAQIWASASGKLRIEVAVETAAASGVFTTYYVGFNSTANPNVLVPWPDDRLVLTGVRVRVTRTNLDEDTMNVYSTISGVEQ